MTAIRKPTAEQVKAYRDATACSLQEAKRALMKQWRTEMLELATVHLAIGANGLALETMLAYLIELESTL